MEKNTHIHIRVSNAELCEFKRLAGKDTVSNYIRQRLGMLPARNGGRRPGAGRKKTVHVELPTTRLSSPTGHDQYCGCAECRKFWLDGCIAR